MKNMEEMKAKFLMLWEKLWLSEDVLENIKKDFGSEMETPKVDGEEKPKAVVIIKKAKDSVDLDKMEKDELVAFAKNLLEKKSNWEDEPKEEEPSESPMAIMIKKRY